MVVSSSENNVMGLLMVRGVSVDKPFCFLLPVFVSRAVLREGVNHPVEIPEPCGHCSCVCLGELAVVEDLFFHVTHEVIREPVVKGGEEGFGGHG